MSGGQQALLGAGGLVVGGTLPLTYDVRPAASGAYAGVTFKADGNVTGTTYTGGASNWSRRWCLAGNPTSFWVKVTQTGGSSTWLEQGAPDGIWVQLNADRLWSTLTGIVQTANVIFSYWISTAGNDSTIVGSGAGNELRVTGT